MQIRIFFLTAVLALSISCQDDSPPPDLESISKGHCAAVKMCDPDNFDPLWEDLDACEASSAEDFAAAKMADEPCYEARLAWETCTSMIADCSELDGIPGCGEEYKEYRKYCTTP